MIIYFLRSLHLENFRQIIQKRRKENPPITSDFLKLKSAKKAHQILNSRQL